MNLPPEIMAQLWRASPATLASHLTKDEPRPWIAAAHLQLLSKYITDAVAGRKPRLMINLPPRHGKSELISKWFPIWFLESFPHKQVINTGYGTSFAEEWGRKVRNLAVQYQDKLSFRLSPDSKSAGRWNTTQGGGMYATGTGGGITGRGADCLPAGSMITTERGDMDIADLVAMPVPLRPRVLSVDHDAGRLIWSRIIATKVSTTDELFEITAATGRKVRATARHRFYTPTGYQQAQCLQVGRTELFVLQKGLPAQGVRARKEPATRAQGRLLQQDVLRESPRDQERSPLYPMRRAGEEWAHVLRSGVPQGGRVEQADAEELRSVSESLLSNQQPNGVLQPGVREQGAFGSDAWRRELAFQGRHELREVVSGNAPRNHRAGQRGLRGVRVNDGICHGLDAGANSGENEPSDSPHKRNADGQPGRESGYALRDLPRDTPQVCTSALSVVEHLRVDGVPVYDIQVEGTSNFFANGILAHNCLIIDDPIKDAKEANSLAFREELWRWYTDTARSRVMPGAAIILVLTRWHEDDIAGRLLKAAGRGEGEQWEVLNLPAICEDDGRIDPLGRKPGEALWPDITKYLGMGGVTAKEYLEGLMRGMSNEAWEAQYQGKPGNKVKNGNVYKPFKEARNVRPIAFDPRRPLVWSLDFNVDPMCSTICQWHENDTMYTYLTNERQKTISVLQELCLPNSSTMEACEEFCNRTEQYRAIMRGRPIQVRIYGDRSGQSRKTVGDSDYQAIRDYFKGRPEYSITLHLSKANPAVKDRVNAVNAMLCNALGEVRCFIDTSCTELVADFKQIQWKRDSAGNSTGQIDKSDMHRTHVSDAFGYFVQKEFAMKTQAGAQPGIAQ